jgi:hypothetical protein
MPRRARHGIGQTGDVVLAHDMGLDERLSTSVNIGAPHEFGMVSPSPATENFGLVPLLRHGKHPRPTLDFGCTEQQPG